VVPAAALPRELSGGVHIVVKGALRSLEWMLDDAMGIDRSRRSRARQRGAHRPALFLGPGMWEHRLRSMPKPGTGEARAQVNTYTGYSIGCAIVWALILAIAQRRLDAQSRRTLQQACGAWWSGWTSATIARAGYPPPKKLSPQAAKRLANASLVLVAAGLINVIRVLVSGKLPK
jgi:hypothetical protein